MSEREAVLLRQFTRTRDAEAFSEITRRYAGLVYSTCLRVTGDAAPRTGVAYWCDAAILAQHGIPTVVFGPSGEGMHAAVEYVDLPSAVTCAQVLAETIVAFCG